MFRLFYEFFFLGKREIFLNKISEEPIIHFSPKWGLIEAVNFFVV